MKKSINCILFIFVVVFVTSSALHEYYVSTTSIRWVPSKGEIQMTSRFFLDDLEALMKREVPSVVFSPDSDPEQIDQFIKEFYIKNIAVSIDDAPQDIDYIGREYQEDLLVIYAQIPTHKSIFSSLTVQCSFLTNLFSDQQNIVHIITPKNKKSVLLNQSRTAITLTIEEF